MDIFTIVESIIKLGIPMVVLSWAIFTWVYGGGDLDREADRKSINSHVKKLKKSFKPTKGGGSADYVLGKWMWFGSGFYGLAALWTFVVMELVDIVWVIFHPYSIVALFDDGLISAGIGLLMNQIQNLLAAFVWFGYWADGSVIIWVLIAYAGYWVGVELARRGKELPIQAWLEKLKSLLP